MTTTLPRAALFDLDGVIFDTERQYDIFWGDTCRKYRPDHPGLEREIKGQTLVQIFDSHFSGHQLMALRSEITDALNRFEATMAYDFIPGFEAFLADLRARGVLAAVVTSSNSIKMESVYRAHPTFQSLFNAILTSEDFTESKPSPQCYLRAAQRLGAAPGECVVFEDSINGLRAGLAAGMRVAGLVTTNPLELVKPLSHCQINNFNNTTIQQLWQAI